MSQTRFLRRGALRPGINRAPHADAWNNAPFSDDQDLEKEEPAAAATSAAATSAAATSAAADRQRRRRTSLGTEIDWNWWYYSLSDGFTLLWTFGAQVAALFCLVSTPPSTISASCPHSSLWVAGAARLLIVVPPAFARLAAYDDPQFHKYVAALKTRVYSAPVLPFFVPSTTASSPSGVAGRKEIQNVAWAVKLVSLGYYAWTTVELVRATYSPCSSRGITQTSLYRYVAILWILDTARVGLYSFAAGIESVIWLFRFLRRTHWKDWARVACRNLRRIFFSAQFVCLSMAVLLCQSRCRWPFFAPTTDKRSGAKGNVPLVSVPVPVRGKYAKTHDFPARIALPAIVPWTSSEKIDDLESSNENDGPRTQARLQTRLIPLFVLEHTQRKKLRGVPVVRQQQQQTLVASPEHSADHADVVHPFSSPSEQTDPPFPTVDAFF